MVCRNICEKIYSKIEVGQSHYLVGKKYCRRCECYFITNKVFRSVESLNKITDRSKKDIQASITKLERRDIERIKDLCKNYNKLQKYSKLITDADDLQKFKTALQNEIGKKLSDHQLQHAANSIRKAKLYLENVLDGKFIPHGSYGINHTKHNLEYGYLIVGLMQPSKRRTSTKKGRT